ncbi:hypothetical protein [Sphingobacterium hotanense]|nr:hypothetical protein [Sphingobacterium hotanense]MCT1523902.1 hypothetical protein [Sphingobacterium hotanense]
MYNPIKPVLEGLWFGYVWGMIWESVDGGQNRPRRDGQKSNKDEKS